jgi:hypothetical protein
MIDLKEFLIYKVAFIGMIFLTLWCVVIDWKAIVFVSVTALLGTIFYACRCHLKRKQEQYELRQLQDSLRSKR